MSKVLKGNLGSLVLELFCGEVVETLPRRYDAEVRHQ